MNSQRLFNRTLLTTFYKFRSTTSGSGYQPIEVIDAPEGSHIEIPQPKERPNEPLEQRRSRLMYQSRKRGMLENDLLLSTFAKKQLNNFNEEQLAQYDRLINMPSNDWDIFNWANEVKPTPAEYDNEVMKMLKEHCKNGDKESRVRQPDL